jgi:hypothetical protein
MPVDVSVAFIWKNDKLLLAYNEAWGAFTFPMTKPRPHEDGREAAARAACEHLGRTSDPKLFVDDFRPIILESLRDGVRREYQFTVYNIVFQPTDELTDVAFHQWLTPVEACSKRLAPISPSVAEILKNTQIAGVLGI